MGFLQLAKDRYSVRDFKPDPIEKEKFDLLLQAAQASPTAKNQQPQRIYAITSQKGLETIRQITPCAFNAPCVLIMCVDTDGDWTNPYDNRHSGEIDISIVTSHVMFMAQELGLGTTWVCYFDREKVKKAFDLPENIYPCTLLPIGYPSDTCTPSERHSIRRDPMEYLTML